MDVILIFIIYKRIVCFTNIIYQYINTFASQSSIMNKSIARIVVFIFKNMFVDLSCSNTVHSVHHPHPPPPTPYPFSAGGVEPPTKFSKRGWAWQDLKFERGVAEKEGGNFFQGGFNFTKKINYNLKYLMTKRVCKQKYFSLS